MKREAISFSAQFGGTDVSAVLKPHFFGLKKAFDYRDHDVPGDGFREIAFILRADGSIQQFNIVGSDKIEVNRKGEYVSIDIGVPIEYWKERSNRDIAEYLVVSMRQGLGQIFSRLNLQRIRFEESVIRSMFETGAQRYLDMWPTSSKA